MLVVIVVGQMPRQYVRCLGGKSDALVIGMHWGKVRCLGNSSLNAQTYWQRVMFLGIM